MIATFKAYYLRRTFARAIAAAEEDTKKSLMQLWKDYHVYNCLKNIAWDWDDVTKEHINGIWKQTLERLLHDFKRFAHNKEIAIINKVVANTANNCNMDVDEARRNS